MASPSATKAVVEGCSGGDDGNAATKLPPCGFLVKSGKKGNIPISVEKRPKGKKVTIVSNVQGSAPSLLSALTSLLGSGGTVRQEASGYHWTVELQGDQSERITSALVQLGCVQGLRKPVEDREKKKTTEVVTRICAYDKFLRNGDNRSKSRTRAEAFAHEACLPDADCTKWHGAWFYCRGRCTQSDMSDVWDETLDDKDCSAGRSSSSCAARPAPSSVAELNITLRDLGLLPVVGGAHRLQRLARNPASAGMSLADYRKAAVAPGARLLTYDDPDPKTARRGASRARAASSRHSGGEATANVRGTSRPSKPAKPAPSAKVGTYSCPMCHCVFGLQTTWKLHMETVHGGSTMSMKAPSQKAAISRSASASKPAQVQRHIPGLSLMKPTTPSKVPKKSSTKVPAKAQKQPKVEPSMTKTSCHVCGADEEVQLSLSAQPDDICEETKNEHNTASDGSDVDHEFTREPFTRKVLESPVRIGEMYRVTALFEPSGTEEEREVQLRVKVGDHVNVRWVPEDESETYWVYVSMASGKGDRNDKWGYVPMHIMEHVVKTASPKFVPQADPKTPEPQMFASSVSESEDVPIEWLESLQELDLSERRSALFWMTFDSLRFKEPLKDAWCLAMEQVLFGATSPRDDLGAEPKLGITPAGAHESARPDSEEKAYTSSFPTLQKSAAPHPVDGEISKGGNRWNTSAKQMAASTARGSQHQISVEEPCPICGIRFSQSNLESHIERCISKLEAAQATQPCVVDQRVDSALDKGTQAWARKKLKDLVDRFCVTSRLDVDVALASLIACSSAAEMRSEAVSLIFDNQPVKNFAGELWRRRTAAK